ncbi:MAG: hypothetical protein ACRC0F_01840 [Cetobacterium sp.]
MATILCPRCKSENIEYQELTRCYSIYNINSVENNSVSIEYNHEDGHETEDSFFACVDCGKEFQDEREIHFL